MDVARRLAIEGAARGLSSSRSHMVPILQGAISRVRSWTSSTRCSIRSPLTVGEFEEWAIRSAEQYN